MTPEQEIAFLKYRLRAWRTVALDSTSNAITLYYDALKKSKAPETVT